MKILIISNSEWDDNNSFGNTFSNFFAGATDIEFANIYCRNGVPNTKLCERFLRIDDKQLIKHFFKRKSNPVRRMENVRKDQVPNTANGVYSFAKRKRWAVFFLLRELLWSLSRYKNKDFIGFIEEFKPDIIFLPTYPFAYINKMALWIKKRYNLPMVSYISDDEFTLKRISFSPFFWIQRLIQRKYVVKTLKISEKVYCISKIQQDALKNDINVDSKVLTKFYPFSQTEFRFLKNGDKKNIDVLYAGNIGSGRWKSLIYLMDAVKKINSEGEYSLCFKIFTASPVPKKLRKKAGDNCSIEKPVDYERLKEIRESANIVVHAESCSYKDSLVVRQSFSTKIVDLFYSGKCIFAIGRKDVASIAHLIENNAAVVATNKNEVCDKLRLLLDEKKREEIARAGFLCGINHHDRKDMQAMFLNDLKEFADKT